MSATNSPATIEAALRFVRERTELVPDIALILGSGMGPVAEAIDGISIPYADVPGLCAATVHTHRGEFKVGTMHGRNVVAMCGRLHAYEGHTTAEATLPLRLVAAMGATTLVITNAAGGLNPEFRAGDLVAVEDHVSLPHLAGLDPLRGTDDRFVSMNRAYDPELLTALNEAGVQKRGVYAHVVGPTFETPAEVRMLRRFGGDMVGMSTAPETVVARACDMRVCAVSGISNMCVDTLDSAHVTTADEAWETLQAIAPKMAGVLARLVPAI